MLITWKSLYDPADARESSFEASELLPLSVVVVVVVEEVVQEGMFLSRKALRLKDGV